MIKKQSVARYQDSEYYFADCGICDAMRIAEDHGRNLSEEELREAFEQAKKKI